MDPETVSSNTSLEDKTDDFCENPTRDSLAEGLMTLIKPTIDQLDEKVKTTRASQVELRNRLESLSEDLKVISSEKDCPLDLEFYANKLVSIRHKITVVGSVDPPPSLREQRELPKENKNILRLRAYREFRANRIMSYKKCTIPTPKYDVREMTDSVYEPREDSFLLLDALEADLPLIESIGPSLILEIGPGSGIIIAALSSLFRERAFCCAVDVNWKACLATKRTSCMNSVEVDVINGDLVEGLMLRRSVDLLAFNPPYVPSDGSEERDDLDKAWAGSTHGRSSLDRLFPDLNGLMSEKCLGYFVVIEENKPDEVINELTAIGFTCREILKRKVIGEKLSVLRFSRGLPPL